MVTGPKRQQGGRYASLSGLVADYGISVTATLGTIAAGTTIYVPANDRRVWLIAQVISGDDVYMGFGDDAGYGLKLRTDVPFQIDTTIPWTGGLAFTAAANAVIHIVEASLA